MPPLAQAMIIDENPEYLQILQRLLETGGYAVRATANSESALRDIQNSRPDIILMDFSILNSGKLDLSRELKKDKTLSEIPLIFISEKHQSVDIVEAFMKGGVDYISKPFNEIEVLARVQTHLANFRAKQEIQKARLEAEKASQAKSMFLANMSHEIRTPLNAITGMTYLVLQSELSEKQKKFVRRIQQSSELLMALINDILDFSKVEANQLAIEQIPFELSDVFENLNNILSIKSNETQLEFVFDKDPNIPDGLVGDPLRLGQVLVNLSGNAFKFTKEGQIIVRAILINSSASTVRLRFEIEDSGVGISEEATSRLFKSFSQADNSVSRVYGGTGLGLAICKSLVELMNGNIGFESKEGKGSKFFFELPFLIDKDHELTRNEIPKEFDKFHTVIVDDNTASGDILTKMLKAFGHKVSCYTSTSEALSSIKEKSAIQPVDLILLDWSATNFSSHIFKAQLNELKLDTQPKVLIMSNGFEAEREKYLFKKEDEDSILIKPITPSTLLDNILTLLGKPLVTANKENRSKSRIKNARRQIRGANILLAEDNEVNQELGVELLSRCGANVTLVSNGLEAIDALTRQHYDVVLMDIEMPKLDGISAVKEIRKNKQFQHTPIIAMTAFALSQDRRRALEAGMNDYITKPLDPAKLYLTIAKYHQSDLSQSGQDNSTHSEPIYFDDDVKQTLETIEGIDTSEGLARCEGNVDLYKRLLKRYYERIRRFEGELSKALDKGDVNETMHLAHSLKGASANVGATQVYLEAVTLEFYCRNDSFQSLLREQLRNVVVAINVLVKNQPSFIDNDDNSSTGAITDINAHLEELSILLEQSDSRASAMIEQLNTSNIDGLAGYVDEMQKAIKSYDFEKASTILQKMLLRKAG
ncbi:MAG: response regulator [Gammaproteobacteria bacterium]|nr:response regulator [Gammaproteobacteria bacterium]